VSFTITGSFGAACTSGDHLDVRFAWPTAEPMPRSLMPCGQPKLSSTPSQPVSSTFLRTLRQSSSVQGTISEAITARSGQSRFTWRISSRFTCSGRSEMSSMLLKPITRRSCESSVE
jgi:hypothetical protein